MKPFASAIFTQTVQPDVDAPDEIPSYKRFQYTDIYEEQIADSNCSLIVLPLPTERHKELSLCPVYLLLRARSGNQQSIKIQPGLMAYTEQAAQLMSSRLVHNNPRFPNFLHWGNSLLICYDTLLLCIFHIFNALRDTSCILQCGPCFLIS